MMNVTDWVGSGLCRDKWGRTAVTVGYPFTCLYMRV